MCSSPAKQFVLQFKFISITTHVSKVQGNKTSRIILHNSNTFPYPILIQSHPFNILQGSVHNVSIPALSIRDPDCHGYLYKQGHNIKTWRRRYFVLKNGFLYYYSDMSNTVALGVAKLIDYTIQIGVHTGKKFCFNAISTDSSSRTYHFAAESEMDRTR